MSVWLIEKLFNLLRNCLAIQPRPCPAPPLMSCLGVKHRFNCSWAVFGFITC